MSCPVAAWPVVASPNPVPAACLKMRCSQASERILSLYSESLLSYGDATKVTKDPPEYETPEPTLRGSGRATVVKPSD